MSGAAICQVRGSLAVEARGEVVDVVAVAVVDRAVALAQLVDALAGAAVQFWLIVFVSS